MDTFRILCSVLISAFSVIDFSVTFITVSLGSLGGMDLGSLEGYSFSSCLLLAVLEPGGGSRSDCDNDWDGGIGSGSGVLYGGIITESAGCAVTVRERVPTAGLFL